MDYSSNDISDLRPSSLNQILKNNMECINESVIKTEYELHQQHHNHLRHHHHRLDDDNNNVESDDVINLHLNNSNAGDKNNNNHQLTNNNRIIIGGNDGYQHQMSQVMDKDGVNVQHFTRLMDGGAGERSVGDVSTK